MVLLSEHLQCELDSSMHAHGFGFTVLCCQHIVHSHQDGDALEVPGAYAGHSLFRPGWQASPDSSSSSLCLY